MEFKEVVSESLFSDEKIYKGNDFPKYISSMAKLLANELMCDVRIQVSSIQTHFNFCS